MQNKALKWVLLLMLFIPLTSTFAQSNKYKLKAKKYYHKLNAKKDPLIIDTRPAFKFQENRIQNAVLAEEIEDLLKLVKIVPKDEPIFIYCQKGDRSQKAAETLKEKGYTKVYELKGGLLKWMDAGLPLDTVKYE
ncbi:rhodanese-like domain-containing protein [Carboxylicivirga linearis]|uniref:Rhodanese-like domain-containing protein n=1 Tax=Carboxylicivirga linearis TaxID=1628157 RepID=A0ABS5JWV7_9BACT|nr:rhodanese-like domain-containing protein [Carboxylicivirga linearis]MBS2098831.1 rhodanese-like domain-containing protein [Carboxylicivirga linearis]